jgi:hypothetical protein
MRESRLKVRNLENMLFLTRACVKGNRKLLWSDAVIILAMFVTSNAK